MNIVVTGGAGFIGSHIAEALLSAGHQVTVIDDLSSGKASNIPSAARFVQCDVTGSNLGAVLKLIGPDAVVHCAAQVSVSTSVTDPRDDLDRNVTGTVNLLLASAQAGVRAIVYAASAAVYGVPQYLPIDEKHPTAPLSPYGLSKLTAEWYVRMLGAQLGLRWVILRYANVYGPRQQPHTDGAVVPAFFDAFLSGRDPVIHGDGEQTRDFVYVTDVARANLLALTGSVSGTFNIATGQATSINTLWKATARVTGWKGRPVYGAARSGDITHSWLASDAAKARLKWRPNIDLAKGLRLIAEHTAASAEAEVAAASEAP
jgi:UDP-glucose 4-epimerase